ncbi:MAG: N-acetylmuramoyl-L-alanine amidase [Bavariicoccus seileri]|uniref:N-acetylmuramoyl-L-alanine amidase n=1 Tax=Bavariicoccus seileri TaxID=549685 RepID=UPI003F900A86
MKEGLLLLIKNRITITLCILFLFLTSLFLLFSGMAKATASEETIVKKVQAFGKPDTTAELDYTFKPSDTVVVLSKGEHWSHVMTADQQFVWIPNEALNQDSTPKTIQIATISSEYANVRNKPTVESTLLGVAYQNDKFEVVESSNGWIRIRFQEGMAYVSQDLVTISEGPSTEISNHNREGNESQDKKVIIKADNTPVYAEANKESTVQVTAAKNQAYKFLSDEGDFYKIEIDDQTTGYILPDVVETNFAKQETDYKKADSLADATIVIDPGHGGEDPGALSEYTSFYEKDFTLKVGLAVEKALKKTGAKVLMTRSADENISLANRAALSSDSKADAFISFHFDTTEYNYGFSGSTTYFYSDLDETLASFVNDELTKDTLLPNNGIKFGDYLVLRENTQPSILIELGFMNNASDVTTIQTDKFADKIAKEIVSGLTNYFDK